MSMLVENTKESNFGLGIVIQFMNTEFTNHLRTNGHKYQIDTSGHAVASADNDDDGWVASEGRLSSEKLMAPKSQAGSPARLSNVMALKCVGQALIRTRVSRA